jgi:hypothetical protein
MKKKSLVCVIFALSMSVCHEIQPMRVKKAYEKCKINPIIGHELFETFNNNLEKLSLPANAFVLQEIIFNAIPKKLLTAWPKKKIYNDSKKFLESPCQKTLEQSKKFIIDYIIKIFKQSSKDTHKRRTTTTETLCGMVDEMNLRDMDNDEADNSEEMVDRVINAADHEDEIIQKKDAFYFKAKAWWEKHGHKENTTFLWWRDCRYSWEWYGSTQNDIDIPLVPEGFTIEFIKDDLRDDTCLAFRCIDCQGTVYFNEMYKILKIREFKKNYDADCKNCYLKLKKFRRSL